MAKRRMLSIPIVETDKFYKLSTPAQALYMHLNLNADDDGFVDKWRTVMRCARIEKKHYLSLRDGGYIIELSATLIVITDWHRHNTIRADRYIATSYAKELQGLSLDENKRYFKASQDVLVATCVPQIKVDKNRVDKSSTDKTRVEKDREVFTTNNSYTHSDAASQPSIQSVDISPIDRLTAQALKNNIRLYFMKKYQTVDTFGFIEHYEARNWMAEDGTPVIGNFRDHIDRWMANR